MRRWVVCSALTVAVVLSVLGVWTRAAVGQAQTEVPLTVTKDAFDPAELKVKAGTQPGTTQKVKGRGIPGTNGHAGDLFVTFDIAVPTKLDKEQKAAVEALAAAFTDDPRADLPVTAQEV